MILRLRSDIFQWPRRSADLNLNKQQLKEAAVNAWQSILR